MKRLDTRDLKKVLGILGVAIVAISSLQINVVEAHASGQDNIVQRADYAYDLTWTSLKTVTGWKGLSKYTFYAGSEYHIPYGQPYGSSGYFYYNVSIDDYIAAVNDVNSLFYTKRSSGLASSTYYCTDCSGFVSYCWDLKTRHTTSTMSLVAKNYGLCTKYNVANIEIGDALNKAGSHVVLVTDIIDNNGELSYEITEQTPPQLKRSVLTQEQLISRYSKYTILRNNSRDSVQAIGLNNGVIGNIEDESDAAGDAASETNIYSFKEVESSDIIPLIPSDMILSVFDTDMTFDYIDDNSEIGDIDFDGVITKNDALVIYDYIHDVSDLMPDQLERSDVNADGVIDDVDVLCIIKLASIHV